MPFLAVLTSKAAGPIAGIIALILAVACGTLWIKDRVLESQLTVATNTVGQLKGSLEFQNQAVEDLGKKSAAATARAQSLLQASQAAHAGDVAQAAALVAKPVETDPVLACKAADQAILGAIQ